MRPYSDAVLQRLPFQKLRSEKGLAFEFVNVVNGADVGVIEGGGGVGFAPEGLERLMIFDQRFGQEFEGDKAVQAGVLGLLHDAHATAPSFSRMRWWEMVLPIMAMM